MDIRPIRTDEDLSEALKKIDKLWGAATGTPEGDELEILCVLAGAYEDRRWPLEPVSPRDILEFAVTDMGHSQKELAELLKSRPMASELLNGKRRISLDIAQKISAAWSIPIQLLVSPYPEKSSKSSGKGLTNKGITNKGLANKKPVKAAQIKSAAKSSKDSPKKAKSIPAAKKAKRVA